jgi:hypothetical protein
MQYARSVTRVLIGIVVLAACSGKAEQKPPPPPPVVVVDAAPPPPIDAPPPPFAVVEKKSKFGDSIEIHPHGAPCPMLDWRLPDTVHVKKCRDQPFAGQIETLRDMASYIRGVDRRFDAVRIVGGVDFYGWPELGRRFIEYAKTHPWKRDKQSLNAYVIEAGSKGDMFPEYAAIFQKKPKLTSAEKCSAGRPGRKDEAGKFLTENGATGNAEIPLGCSIGFIELEQP